MGTISSGTGLISGMDIQGIVKQLMAIESKPLDLLKTRITSTTNEMTAYQTLSAQIMAIKSALSPLTQLSTFRTKSAASSNEDALTATASSSTAAGMYRFTVAALASTHQLVSTGFADRTSTFGAGSLTFNVGRGNLAPATPLSDLNGGAGVRRGVVRITDRAGSSAEIDLRTATNLQEVVEAFNSQSSAKIQASIQNGRLVLSDKTGLTSGNIVVADIGTGKAAADLGIAGTFSVPSVKSSNELLYLTGATRLDRLNDGMGVRTKGLIDDFSITTRDGSVYNINVGRSATMTTRLDLLNDGAGVQRGSFVITNRAGQSATIRLDDLGSNATLQDVVTKINSAGISVTASMTGGKLSLSDASEGTVSNFKVEELDGGHVAADLGIKADVAATSITGTNVYRMDTIDAVRRVINEMTDGNVTASISSDGHSLTLTDKTTGMGSTEVKALNGSKAAADLGLLGSSATGTLAGNWILGGPNTVLLSSLNGGSGVSTGGLVITRQADGATTETNVDVSSAHTLADILDAINSKTDANGKQIFEAEVSPGGSGIQIRDIGGGAITAVSGDTATDLKLQASDGQLTSTNLHLRSISESTKLADLNGGKGISYGTIQIINSKGVSTTLTLNSSLHKTVGEVIDSINSLKIKDADGNEVSLNVTARLNANGDGIEIVDEAGGTGTLQINDLNNGTTAAELGIAGKATGTVLTGTMSKTVTFGSGDTLEDAVAKINAAGAGVRASIINDGTTGSPYRLVLTSTTAGSAGQMNYTLSGTELAFSALSEAEDAKVVLGDLNSPSSIIVSSSSNQVKNVVDGLSLDLHEAGTGPVEITVKQDTEAVKAGVDAVIKAFNAAIDKIDEFTKYDADTAQKGVLLGDAAVERVRSRLYDIVGATVNDPSLPYKALSQIGIVVGDGGHLVLKDETKLNNALANNPEAVEKLFTLTTKDAAGKPVNKGIGVRLNAELEALAGSAGSVISNERDSLQDRIDLYTKRSEDMQELLTQKEGRLYRQFQAMETALSSMQSQQSALAGLSSLLSSMSSSSSSGSSK